MADKRKFGELFWGILLFVPTLLILPVLFVLAVPIKVVKFLWRIVGNYISQLNKKRLLLKLTDVTQ